MVIKDWNNQTKGERRKRAIAIKAVADNIGAISKAPFDLTSSFLAVINLLNAIKLLTSRSPKGRIDSLPAMYTTSCMNLFGETVVTMDIKTIAIIEINGVMAKYPEQDIIQGAQTTRDGYLSLKNFVNNIASGNNQSKMNPRDTDKINIFTSRLYMKGFPVIDHLHSHILRMSKLSSPTGTEAKKFLTYIELYVKLNTLRHMIITHLLSLVPKKSKCVIEFVLSLLKTSKEGSRKLLKFIYSHSVKSKFMAYYDGQVYKITNAYLADYLEIPRPDDYPGMSCIQSLNDTKVKYKSFGYHIPWKWHAFSGVNHPYFIRANSLGTVCIWKIVSHGQNLYSIVNKDGCPNGNWCDALLSFDGLTPHPVTVEHNDPVLWEITGNYQTGFL